MPGVQSRRQDIVEAMIRVAGRIGYQATVVADVIAEAPASRTTFYNHFEDKHDCFTAAYDAAAERVIDAIEAGCASEAAWLDRARRGLETLVELFAAEPELARTFVVEAAMAGAETRRRQVEAVARIAALLEAGCDRPGEGELPPNTALMAVGAAGGLLFDAIRTGAAEQLPERLPELRFALLTPFLGPERAAAEMHPLAAAPAAST